MPIISSNNTTAVSWGAIFAGAATATALSFSLMILGFGFGLLSVSPWTGEGASAEAIGIGSIVWLIVIHLAAAGLGGYLAGRLRVKWPDIHNDEIYFRDTAHGLVTWAVATVAAIFLMGTAASTIVTAGAEATAGVAEHAAPAVEQMDAGYFANTMLRTRTWDQRADEHAREEMAAIIVRSLRAGELTEEDRAYLSDFIADRTELTSDEARQRVDEVYARAQANMEQALEVADDARRAAAWAAIWIFIGLLAGAFFASLMATFGGRQRDNVFNAEP
jgi:hypothetical protein